MEYNSVINKNEAMPFIATWMDLEVIILKWRKSDREKQISYAINYMWHLKNDTKEFIYKSEIDSQI